MHLGVYGVLLGNLVPAVLLNIAALPFYVHRLRFSWEPELFRHMASFAIANVPAMLAFYVLNFSDRFLLNRYSTLSQVGLYTASYTLAQPVYFAGFAFRLAWPQWHYRWLKQPDVHKRQVARGYTYYMLLTCTMVVLLGAFMPLMIRVLLRRPSFWGVGTAAFVLILSYAAYNTYHLFLVGVNVTRKNRYLPVPVVIAALVNIAINIVFIPKYGMMAAAWSTLIGFVLLAVMMRSLSNHYYPIPHEWKRVGKIMLATAVTLLAVYGVGRATGTSVYMPFWSLVRHEIAMSPLLALFPLILWATGFLQPAEKPAVRRLWLQATGRGRQAAAPAPGLQPAAAAASAGAVAGEGAAGAADDLDGVTFTEEQLAQEEDHEVRAWSADARDDPGALP
jgi:O-antigen/teichoic acid export membrane protein